MTAFVPHTLTEQIALITAEAEGRVIFELYVDGMRLQIKPAGRWAFEAVRYEVEQPLMEGWANQYADDYGCLYTTEAEAREGASSRALRIAVHMREVR